MNYRFVTIINNLTINSTLFKGKVINGSMRISNGYRNFKNHFENIPFQRTIGLTHYTQFENSVYIYETGNYEDLVNNIGIDEDILNKVGKENIVHYYLDFFMRKAQHFASCLWFVKDNCAYVLDGFLQVYPDNNPEEGRVVHNTMSFRPTKASREISDTIFTPEEIVQAINYYNIEPVTSENEGDWHFPKLNPLTKDLGRIGRANYFALIARSSVFLPLKISNYCTVFECLFTSDNTELTHKISERFAFLYGKNSEEKKDYFKLVKDAYKIRSKTVHGQSISTKEDELEEISKKLDDAIRLIFTSYYNSPTKYEIFSENNSEKFEQWFTNLIFE